MKQFYKAYASVNLGFRKILQLPESEETIIVASMGTQFEDISNSLLAKLSWTHHRTIFSRCKSEEEMEFYLRASIENSYTLRELDRQISAGLFERSMLSHDQLPLRLQSENRELLVPLKNSCVFEFLNLSETHSERELQQTLVQQVTAVQNKFKLDKSVDFIGATKPLLKKIKWC